mgnify:CR=1 FL=1
MVKLINVNSIEELRFNLTEELNNNMIELLLTQQMLNENKLSRRDRKLLEHHKKELLEQFRLEFQRNNIEQIKLYKELINK